MPTNGPRLPSAPVLAILIGAAVVVCLTHAFAQRSGQGSARNAPLKFQRYETRYYQVHTDLPPIEVREAAVRMDKMAEEYWKRTRDFSGVIRNKFTFHLFREAEDYYASGAPRGSAGVYEVGTNVLKAIAGEKLSSRTWHVVQHEGFHQFADAVIGTTNMPIWVNEGFAEYFGLAVFTGDGFVSGVIPNFRMERVQKLIRENRHRPLVQMMRLPHSEWNEQLSLANYDQAWAMVQFLAHGDDGKYQGAFGRFMVAIGRNTNWERAWAQEFGGNERFEQKWRDWWLGLPANPTLQTYAHATASTIASFVGRSFEQRQTFSQIEEFIAAAKARNLRMSDRHWLPESLMEQVVTNVEALEALGVRFDIRTIGNTKQPSVQCTMPTGQLTTFDFVLRDGLIVEVKSQSARSTSSPSRSTR
jgi:hypothetical protein